MLNDGKDQQPNQHEWISPPQLAPPLNLSSPAIHSSENEGDGIFDGITRTRQIPGSVQDSPDTVMYERTVNSIYESYARFGEGVSSMHDVNGKSI